MSKVIVTYGLRWVEKTEVKFLERSVFEGVTSMCVWKLDDGPEYTLEPFMEFSYE